MFLPLLMNLYMLMKKIFALATAILIINYGHTQCPPEGRSLPGKRPLSAKEKALNVKKNASAVVQTEDAQFWDIKKDLQAAKNNDRNKYTEGDYVYAEGYLVSAQEQGPESCNCHLADKNNKDGDVHIYIGLTKNALKSNCIVVEITPAYKALNTDYEQTLSALTKTKVRIYGYRLYDYMHERNSVNLCKTCKNGLWRKTCWEIHPIVKIEQAQ